MMHGNNVTTVPSGQDSNNVIRRANHELGLYDLPSFYNPDFVRSEVAIEAGTETAAELARSGRMTPFRSVDGPMDKSPSSRELDGRATASATGRGLYRNKCFSFLALVAGLAAFGCSLAALAGTTNWVDTWEPIDLPPTQEWPTLFGTGYGSLMPSRSGSNGKDKSSGSKSSSTTGNKVGGSNLGFANGPDVVGKSHSDDLGSPQQAVPVVNVTTTRPSPATTRQQTSTETPFVTRPTVPVAAADDDEFDYEDYEYARDQQQQQTGNEPIVDDEIVMLRQEDEQQDEEPRRSLVVVFHVGLFRACPVLKGELQPSSVVLPNLPCAALEYLNWRPLTGQSFRLWRNVEFTIDFLNKLRYATPCFILGSFIGLVAIVIAIGGRCTGPDRTLICSSLHILAGLSLGSGLIIFVSVLHEEFSLPSLRSSRHAGGWPPGSSRHYNGAYQENVAVGGSGSSSSVAFYSDSRTIGATMTTGHVTGSGLVSAALIPSFRYGWSFYAALAAFVSSELAAAVYIFLHTHIFKWASRTRAAAEAAASSTTKLLVSNCHSASCKEIGVQTSPLSSASLLMMMEKRTGATATAATSAIVDVAPHQQVPYCDLLALDAGRAVQRDGDQDSEVPPFPVGGSGCNSNNSSCRPSPMYINAGSSTETDCTCQIHYATYRPKMRNSTHVAGIHRASTMPRKVAFAGELTSVYQQTPL